MADYDANLIKPVQGLQNISGLAPAKRREDRNSRRQSNEKSEEQDETAKDEEATPPSSQLRAKGRSDRDDGGIDYCA